MKSLSFTHANRHNLHRWWSPHTHSPCQCSDGTLDRTLQKRNQRFKHAFFTWHHQISQLMYHDVSIADHSSVFNECTCNLTHSKIFSWVSPFSKTQISFKWPLCSPLSYKGPALLAFHPVTSSSSLLCAKWSIRQASCTSVCPFQATITARIHNLILKLN